MDLPGSSRLLPYLEADHHRPTILTFVQPGEGILAVPTAARTTNLAFYDVRVTVNCGARPVT